MLVFGDPLRKGAEETVAGLRALGIDTWLVSGDSYRTTQAVACSLGIGHYRGQVLPDGKADLVKRLREEGHKVAMIGDGINDTPALAHSDVGCAFATGTDVTAESADVLFLYPDLRKLLSLIKLSSRAMRTIRQNLLFAFLYNAVAVPLAATGLLNPFIAVLAMATSSLTVTGNALRLTRKQNLPM
jgi:Cu+-exporting ATPase